MFGFFRVAAAVPISRVADVDYNTKQILEIADRAAAENASLVVFPELCLTGYSCGDLFLQQNLKNAVANSLSLISSKTRKNNTILVIGAPLISR